MTGTPPPLIMVGTEDFKIRRKAIFYIERLRRFTACNRGRGFLRKRRAMERKAHNRNGEKISQFQDNPGMLYSCFLKDCIHHCDIPFFKSFRIIHIYEHKNIHCCVNNIRIDGSLCLYVIQFFFYAFNNFFR